MLNDALKICEYAISSCNPKQRVKEVLEQIGIDSSVYLVAVGKAAFSMAEAASEVIDIKKGIVISKYHHIDGQIDNVDCYEAAHPLPDDNSLSAGKKVIDLVSNLKEDDLVLFLLSGGASALFESSKLSLAELSDINNQMLRKGMNIDEMNTIRKALSDIKGGKFANICKPAKIISLILSDVVSGNLSSIGSGPTVSNHYDLDETLKLIEKYNLSLSEKALDLIRNNKTTTVDNAENIVIASVKMLADKAKEYARKIGYEPIIISDQLMCDLKEGRKLLLDNIERYVNAKENIALIMCGEMTLDVKGDGLGGRNQHLVLSMAKDIARYDNVLVMSLGSDGTDGPTDAAGGYVDHDSLNKFMMNNIDVDEYINNCDSYHALKKIDALIKTGPTMTNVNDIIIVLIKNNK